MAAQTGAIPAPAKTLMVYGDSLVAGYGLDATASFPAQLDGALRKKGYQIKVINAGVSGDTTAAGLTRLDWSLRQNPDYVLLVLGGNDMLRAIDPKVTEDNLRAIMEKLEARKIPVLLAGMESFRNLGKDFSGKYRKMYAKLADRHAAILYPFFLDGVALKPEFNLDDGVHPNAQGVSVIVEKILPDVEKLLAKKKM